MTPEIVKQVAGSLINTTINHVEPLFGGRNSRIYRVENGDSPFALKFFRPDVNNSRDRFEAETSALNLFAENGLECTPRIVAQDRKNNCLLMEWIGGQRISNFDVIDIDKLSDFVKNVYNIAKQKKHEDLRFATEACLTGNEIVKQIKRRLEKLEPVGKSHPELHKFLKDDFVPAFNEITYWSEEEYKRNGMNLYQNISQDQLILSPVDIGFHNCLKTKDKMYFLDFEFFGWDDPVKLVADTLQHPGSMLKKTQNERLSTYFNAIFQKDPQFTVRLRCLYPLFGLKWCMIMLNPFLPGYQAIAPIDPNIKNKQLVKVRSLTENVLMNFRNLDHG